MILDRTKDEIACIVIKVLWGRFNSFPTEDTESTNAPFHEAFLNAFKDDFKRQIEIPYLINISSWLHGLKTTLGQVFFEEVSHVLSEGCKLSFTKKQNNHLQITKRQQDVINKIIAELKNNKRTPDLKTEDNLLDMLKTGSEMVDAPEFTVDNYIEMDDCIECYELKTVRPNAGQMQGEKQKILLAKAALINKHKNKKVSYFLGFPFDPWSSSETGFDKKRFLSKIIEGEKFLDIKEILLSSELWDKLSGEPRTMEVILEIINKIATPNFLDKYNFIKEPSNKLVNSEKYLTILREWGLHREIILASDRIKIEETKKKDKKFSRVMNASIFDNDGNYNKNRYIKWLEMKNP